MDDVEKGILRRRRGELVENLEVTPDLVLEMKEEGLLSSEGVTAIEAGRKIDCYTI